MAIPKGGKNGNDKIKGLVTHLNQAQETGHHEGTGQHNANQHQGHHKAQQGCEKTGLDVMVG
jgi:hypothetical protein